MRTTGFPSVPLVLIHVIADRWPNAYVATRFPGPDSAQGDVQGVIKSGGVVVRVLGLGGNRDRFNASQRVAIDVIAASEGEAEDLAEDIATFLIDTRPIRATGIGMVDGAEIESAPAEASYADPTITQFSATYVVQTRRIEAR
jgi:hypothetical protein